MLVEKLCQLKKELVKQEEKAEFFEEHIAQLTEDTQGKSRYSVFAREYPYLEAGVQYACGGRIEVRGSCTHLQFVPNALCVFCRSP